MITMSKKAKKDKKKEEQQTLLPKSSDLHATTIEQAPMEYLEINIQMAGSVAFQKVSGGISFKTSDPELLPRSNSKEDIGEAIQELFTRSEDGVSVLVDKIKEGLVVLKNYRDEVE